MEKRQNSNFKNGRAEVGRGDFINEPGDGEIREDIVCGINPVKEALATGREIESLLVASGKSNDKISRIIARCNSMGVIVKEVSPKKLDFLCKNSAHQGVALNLSSAVYFTVGEVLEAAKEKGEPPFIIVCDEIEDPHNMGAIIRTAECAGVHGIIVPKRRSAPLGYTVSKTSAGALEHMKIVKVPNLCAELERLKEAGLWIYGADMDGQDYRTTDFSGGCVLVIGNEGRGLGRLVREKCDVIVSLPMKGQINSLNASVAAGILMYKVAEKRQ